MKRNFFNKMMLCAAAVCSGMLYTSCADNLDEGNDNGKVENGIALNCNVGNYKTDADVQLVRALDVKLPNGRNAKLVECDFNFIDDDVVNQAVAQTRGTMINNISQLNNQKLKVNLYFGKDNYPTATTDATCTGEYTFGDNSKLVKVNNAAKDWDRTNPYAEFAAIYPTDEALSKDFKKTKASEFSFSYTAPTDCKSQKDVMVAYAQAQVMSGQKPPVPTLTLKHALTAINFAVGSHLPNGLKLVGVSLEDEKGKTGTCTITTESTGVKEFTWNSKDKAKYTLKLDKEIDFTNSTTSNTVIKSSEDQNKNNYTFFVMPKTDGKVTMSLLFKDAQNKYSKSSVEVTKPNWRAGHTITYTLDGKVSGYIFTKDVTTPVTADKDGKVSFNLTSCKSYAKTFNESNTKHASKVEWEVSGYSYVDEDGKTKTTKPEWFDITTSDKAGAITQQKIEGKFDKNKLNKNYLDELNKYLKGNKHDKQVKLAGENGKETTANCYIIDGPGEYQIPLVYGNALVNGTDNKSAYQVNGKDYFPTHEYTEDTERENKYKPYADKPSFMKDVAYITKPWIKDNGANGKSEEYTATTAEVLWADVDGKQKCDGLITDAKVTEGKYLTFKVTDKIKNGNALIAVKNKEGKILWSWHLWFNRKQQSVKIADNMELMAQNLGMKFTQWEGVQQKTITVTFKQKEKQGNSEAKTLQVTFVQPDDLKMDGTSPAYQTFRKDPLSIEFTKSGNVISYKCTREGDQSGSFHLEEKDWKEVKTNRDNLYNNGDIVKVEQRPSEQGTTNYKNGVKKTIEITYGMMTQNPTTLYATSNLGPYCQNSFIVKPADENNHQYWCNTKTVYDPCPVGYQLPTDASLQKLNNSGQYIKDCHAIQFMFNGKTFYLPNVGILWGGSDGQIYSESKPNRGNYETRYGSCDGYAKKGNQWKRLSLYVKSNSQQTSYGNGDVPTNGMAVRPMKSTSK